MLVQVLLTWTRAKLASCKSFTSLFATGLFESVLLTAQEPLCSSKVHNVSLSVPATWFRCSIDYHDYMPTISFNYGAGRSCKGEASAQYQITQEAQFGSRGLGFATSVGKVQPDTATQRHPTKYKDDGNLASSSSMRQDLDETRLKHLENIFKREPFNHIDRW